MSIELRVMHLTCLGTFDNPIRHLAVFFKHLNTSEYLALRSPRHIINEAAKGTSPF